MPSPLGHSLAGLAVGWAATDPSLEPRASRWSAFVLVSAVVAAAPDLDLLYPASHRLFTHGVGATLVVMIIAGMVTRQVTGRIKWRLVLALGAAHATHIVLDWMGTDRFPPPGIRALWPFSNQFYLSGWDIFPNVERRLWRPDALGVNVHAALMEVLVVGPVAVFSWVATRTRKNRAPTSAQDDRQPPSVEAVDTVGTWDRPG